MRDDGRAHNTVEYYALPAVRAGEDIVAISAFFVAHDVADGIAGATRSAAVPTTVVMMNLAW